jgi:uncharacterized tellurite resistance protein B-like protein
LGILALAAVALIALLVLRRRRTHPPRRDRVFRAVHRALGSSAPEPEIPAGQDPASVGAATLLLELAKADHEITPEEQDLITAYLRERWQLEGETERRSGAPSPAPHPGPAHTAEMATLLSGQYDRGRRLELVGQLYRIAASDGTLSRHEERLMLRAAALLGLTTEDLAEARRLPAPPA